MELKEEETRVYAALASLPPLQRAVLAWHLDGITTKEIGDALAMTHEAVRQNCQRPYILSPQSSHTVTGRAELHRAVVGWLRERLEGVRLLANRGRAGPPEIEYVIP